MSKQTKRKITVDLAKTKELLNRPSVFQRLGTKKNSAAKKNTECCRQWALNGTCAYGKGCKYAATHTLISPSKQRAANKEGSVKDDGKSRMHSTVVVRPGRSPEGEMDNWDQSDLEYADTDVLEKRRLQLQRELELQLRMDGKDKKKVPSTGSSSSSRSSSSSSVTSSSSATSTSDSNDRDNRKKTKKTKNKRSSSTSSSERDVSKKKSATKSDLIKRKKVTSVGRKGLLNKETITKKQDHSAKKKILAKGSIRKKSLSPGKKSGGTPPIGKIVPKGYSLKQSKSPARRDKNRTASPTPAKERDKDRDRLKDRDKDKERNRARSRSPKVMRRSRSPLRRHGSHPKDPRRKESSERSRPISPKKSRRDASIEKNRKKSPAQARDDRRTHKDRSLERRKDKHEERERSERERKEREKLETLNRQRERERLKDQGKRDAESKRSRARERDRGINKGKGLEKPSKPMERLLPRPEERMAAIAAITNRPIEVEKSSQTSKETHIDRSIRKDRLDRERPNRSIRGADRMDSLEKEHGEYDRALDMPYEHLHSTERPYDRVSERYEEARDMESGSPGPYVPPRERMYGPVYEMPGHPRSYPEGDERVYGEHMAGDIGFDDRRPRRDHSWEGRDVSLDRERPYRGHPHKEWEAEEFHGDWGRERHWPPPHCDPQIQEWGDKEPELEKPWMHRTQPPPGAPRGRVHEDPGYGRNMRMEPSLPVHGMPANMKRRAPMRPDDAPGKKICVPSMPPAHGPPIHGPPAHAPPPHGPPAHSLPAHGPPAHGPPAHGLPAHGPPPHGPPTHGPTPHGPPIHGPPPHGAPAHGSIAHGPPAHGPPIHILPPHASTTHPIAHDPDTEDNTIPDDLSEISDDADDILNMDDKELVAKIKTEDIKTEGQEQNEADDAMDNLDFEEISDGELEEDQRVKGLGDALGVDWASLVAEVRKSKETSVSTSGAREHWEPTRVLARVGLSLDMAGEDLVHQVLNNYSQAKHTNMKQEDGLKAQEPSKLTHSVASIQVAMGERVRQRSMLLGASGLTRALSARRDLAMRRRLCALPALERAPMVSAVAPHPALYAAARALLLQPRPAGTTCI